MTCRHGFIGACAVCDGAGQQPERPDAPPPRPARRIATHLDVLDAMEQYGGGFVKHLAMAWRRADLENHAKLTVAFAGYYEQYRRDAQSFLDRQHRRPTRLGAEQPDIPGQTMDGNTCVSDADPGL